MVNSQVLIHGTETKGSIILTASNATILKRLHCPVYINAEKLNKVTWTGHFSSLQVRHYIYLVKLYFRLVSTLNC